MTDVCAIDRHRLRCVKCLLPVVSAKSLRICKAAAFTCLAGSELKAMLAGWPLRIVASPDCKCNQRARYMDERGCDWCESPEGMTEIMGFLRESAEERGLPFLDLPARLLVRRAIANARKAEARRAKEAEQAAAEGPAA